MGEKGRVRHEWGADPHSSTPHNFTNFCLEYGGFSLFSRSLLSICVFVFLPYRAESIFPCLFCSSEGKRSRKWIRLSRESIMDPLPRRLFRLFYSHHLTPDSRGRRNEGIARVFFSLEYNERKETGKFSVAGWNGPWVLESFRQNDFSRKNWDVARGGRRERKKVEIQWIKITDILSNISRFSLLLYPQPCHRISRWTRKGRKWIDANVPVDVHIHMAAWSFLDLFLPLFFARGGEKMKNYYIARQVKSLKTQEKQAHMGICWARERKCSDKVA